MIRRILTLVGKDLRIFLADPVAIGLGFVVPLVMILVFGMVFGGSESGMNELSVLAVNEDEGPAGRRLLRALDNLEEMQIQDTLTGDTLALDSARARKRVENGRASVALIVPRDFSAGLKQGQVRLYTLEDPRNPITAGVVGGLLQREVFRVFPGLMPVAMMQQGGGTDSLITRAFNSDLRAAINRNFGANIPDTLAPTAWFPESMILGSDPDSSGTDSAASGFGFDAAMGRAFQVKREAVVGQNIANPGIAQSVAGPAVMFMLFAVGGIAASLLREMRDGTANRLRVSGVRPGELLLSRYVWAVLLGVMQLLVMMFYGRLLFGLDIFRDPPAVLMMIFFTALAMSAITLFIAALARTEEQATGYQVTIILAMSAIGGAMFPSFIMPAVIRTLAQVTPVHWAMQGFLDVFWRQQGVAGIAQEALILLGMAVFLVTVSVLIFRRRLKTELG